MLRDKSQSLEAMHADKLYDDYWKSGQNVTRDWDERQFKKVLGPLVGRRHVLDYGCGMGCAYQRQLVASVGRYTGADVSSVALANLREKGLEGRQIDPERGTIDYASESFEGAVCSEVLEHLFDPLQAAREIHRVLKPGGVFVATVPNFGYHAWRFMAFLRAQVPAEAPPENRWSGPHIRFFSKLMLKRMLRAAGFTDVWIGSFDEASVWDVFLAAGHFSIITRSARQHLPGMFHLRFLQDVWPNVFAMRLRAVAWKPAFSS